MDGVRILHACYTWNHDTLYFGWNFKLQEAKYYGKFWYHLWFCVLRTSEWPGPLLGCAFWDRKSIYWQGFEWQECSLKTMKNIPRICWMPCGSSTHPWQISAVVLLNSLWCKEASECDLWVVLLCQSYARISCPNHVISLDWWLTTYCSSHSRCVRHNTLTISRGNNQEQAWLWCPNSKEHVNT